MAPLESCCCGFNLRVGSLIIGWMSVIYGILKLFKNVLGGWSISTFFNSIKNVLNQSQTDSPPLDVELSFFSVENVQSVRNVAMAMALIVLVSMDKKREVKWWSYLSAVLDAFTLLYEVYSMNFIIPLISYFIDVYCILVAYSFSVAVSSSTAMAV